jgi:glycine/D-amino acid oxidase-like deaminating enzyme
MAYAARHRALWLQQVADVSAPPLPPLEGAARADIAIIGGGYVGLWTALRIKEHDPACDVAILEQDICGGGASGRNGGFVLSWWAKIATMVKLFGETDALSLGRAAEEAITELSRFCDEHRIDAHFRQSGWLWTATTAAQRGAWEKPAQLCEKLGVRAFARLCDAEVGRRAGSTTHCAGILETCGATVQPAALARGLRRVALERGVRIYESTPVTHLPRCRPCVLKSPRGTLRVERVVLASNGWAANLPELARALVVISSDMVATAPIPERLAHIGWTGGEAITDSQQMVDYYRTTRDSRIVFGKGAGRVAYGGNIGPEFDRNASRLPEVLADFHRYYPMLRDVPITDDWSGPVDRSADGLPLIGHLGARPAHARVSGSAPDAARGGCAHILYGVGWSGNGVGPSVVGGRVLASLALGRRDAWSACPLVNRTIPSLPREPLRFVGAWLVRKAIQRKESAEARGHKPSRLDAALSRLAPSGLEDH